MIELMIAVALVAIVLVWAVPSFLEFRQRTALNGAADQVVSFWTNARFEALRRNEMVRVNFIGVTIGSEQYMCLGASTTTNSSDDGLCNCFSANACNVGRYPSTVVPVDDNDWRGVGYYSNSSVGDTDTDLWGTAVIDPRRGVLTQASDVGRIFLQAPEGTLTYRLDVAIDAFGRPVVCQPSSGTSSMPGYSNRTC
jgi:type II secretory pathway pseudopilin PulG